MYRQKRKKVAFLEGGEGGCTSAYQTVPTSSSPLSTIASIVFELVDPACLREGFASGGSENLGATCSYSPLPAVPVDLRHGACQQTIENRCFRGAAKKGGSVHILVRKSAALLLVALLALLHYFLCK